MYGTNSFFEEGEEDGYTFFLKMSSFSNILPQKGNVCRVLLAYVSLWEKAAQCACIVAKKAVYTFVIMM